MVIKYHPTTFPALHSCCYKPSCFFCIVFWLFSCSAFWRLQYSSLLIYMFTLPWEFEEEGCYIILSGGWLLLLSSRRKCFCSCSEYKLWGKMCNVIYACNFCTCLSTQWFFRGIFQMKHNIKTPWKHVLVSSRFI
jgi:hypothetical protein